MENIFIKKLIIVMIVSMLSLLVLGYSFITSSTRQNFKNTSEVKIHQVLQILSKNEEEIKTLSDASYEDYLSKARAVAYIVENNPQVLDNPQELINIATLIQIDEIHIFDENGIIIFGTVPEYVGIGVNDGEQIGYFKQILEDSTLELVQEITPATADGKLMQYSAVSRKDKKGIVEIGMRPERMIAILRRNEVSHVLSTVVTDPNEVICLLNKETGVVEGIANNSSNKLNFYDLTFTKKIREQSEMNTYIETYGSEYFAVTFETENGIICVAKDKESVVSSIRENLLLLLFSLVVIGILMIIVIRKLLDRQVISGMKEIISDLRKITEGDLDTVITVANNPEFKELSHKINTMVGSLLRSTSKISNILDALDINIAIYEYRNGNQKVITTNRLGSLLGLNSHDEQELFKDKNLFEKKIFSICQGSQDQEDKMIYHIPLSDGDKYIKIKTFNDFDTTMGIVIDVTSDVLKRNVIIHERDYDVLSELYNRRAFVRETDRLFFYKEQLKVTCIMMCDIDNLKQVNDLYGHHNGDKYIKAGADLIRQVQINNNCIVSRLSGDEFAIMWYGYSTQEEIIVNIENIYQKMLKSTIFMEKGKTYPVRLSGGYAFYPEDSLDKTSLLKLADQAMYSAKQGSKAKFVRYRVGMEKE